mmetsp:Transcript_23789/g.56704  ORF Transcript_23789/g.56704 Transcript_23789/m.56704 type:complete len:269 (-) Transcript_23789:674-1480(-)
MELDDERLRVVGAPLCNGPDGMGLGCEAGGDVEDGSGVRVYLGEEGQGPRARGPRLEPPRERPGVFRRGVDEHLGGLGAPKVPLHLGLGLLGLHKLGVAPVEVALDPAVDADAADGAPREAAVVDGRLQRHGLEPHEDRGGSDTGPKVVVPLGHDDHRGCKSFQLLNSPLDESCVLVELIPDGIEVRLRIGLYLSDAPLLTRTHSPLCKHPEVNFTIVFVMKGQRAVVGSCHSAGIPSHFCGILAEKPPWFVQQRIFQACFVESLLVV